MGRASHSHVSIAGGARLDALADRLHASDEDADDARRRRQSEILKFSAFKTGENQAICITLINSLIET